MRWHWFPRMREEPRMSQILPEKTLSVATFNLHLFVRWSRTRLKAMAKNMTDSKADIIVCQECWDVLAFRKLHEELKSVFPYSVSAYDLRELSGSGIVIWSRWPLELSEMGFTCFQTKGMERIVSKGLLRIRTFDCTIFTTHFPEKHNRELALETLRERMNQEKENPRIILGDFNIDAHSEKDLFHQLQQCMPKQHAFPELPLTSDKQTLDYIFYDGMDMQDSRVIRMDGLTDHHGLLASFGHRVNAKTMVTTQRTT